MKVIAGALLLSVSACGSDAVIPTDPCCAAGKPALRIVNAFASPVDVLVDGRVFIAALPSGIIDTVSADAGNHVLELRQTGASVSVSGPITTTNGALTTIAVVRASNGSVARAMLDDTNSVVPSGATKIRVLHFAPSAGTLQVFSGGDVGSPRVAVAGRSIGLVERTAQDSRATGVGDGHAKRSG